MIMFNIAGQELTVSSPVIVSETKKYITASFTFSNDWNDITDKILHYYNGETYYSIPIVNNELAPEDNFQLSNGLWKFYIHGVNQNGVRITTTPVFLTVKEFGNFEGEIYPDAPQHIVDRLLLLIRTDGDGSLFLANDGTYKGVTVSSQEIAEAVERYLETHPVESVWGNISGDIEDQTDLAEILADLNEAISSIVVPSALSQLLDDSTHRLVTDSEKATWTAKSDFSGDYDDLNNKPNIPSIEGLATEEYVDNAVSGKADVSDIPTNLSDLQDDATHRTVTDTEKSNWNNKSDFSGNYNDLSNKPTLFSGDYNDLTNQPTIPSISGLASETYVDNAIQTAIGNAIGGVY